MYLLTTWLRSTCTRSRSEVAGDHLGRRRLPGAARSGEEGCRAETARAAIREPPVVEHPDPVAHRGDERAQLLGLRRGQHEVVPPGPRGHDGRQARQRCARPIAARRPERHPHADVLRHGLDVVEREVEDAGRRVDLLVRAAAAGSAQRGRDRLPPRADVQPVDPYDRSLRWQLHLAVGREQRQRRVERHHRGGERPDVVAPGVGELDDPRAAGQHRVALQVTEQPVAILGVAGDVVRRQRHRAHSQPVRRR